eukprot:scaffold63190_cov53-Attheya_sp.AAC.2
MSEKREWCRQQKDECRVLIMIITFDGVFVGLRFGTLPGEAFSANDFLDGKSINVVVRFLRDGGEGQGIGETGGASHISVPTTRQRSDSC